MAGMDKFKNCEICGADLGEVKMDSPLYCKKCISQMEKLTMTPGKYKKYRELNETLGKKKK